MDNGFRWLTVGPEDAAGSRDRPDRAKARSDARRRIRAGGPAAAAQGVLGAGAFEVDDCRKTYEELKSRGVQFAGAPQERFYGTEAIMRDGLGNWFSMTQTKPH
jgi:hypothetical protein